MLKLVIVTSVAGVWFCGFTCLVCLVLFKMGLLCYFILSDWFVGLVVCDFVCFGVVLLELFGYWFCGLFWYCFVTVNIVGMGVFICRQLFGVISFVVWG